MKIIDILLTFNAILWLSVGIIIIYDVILYEQSQPLQIYIAGKYSGNTMLNTYAAENAGMQVANTCNYPLVPHLLGYMSEENHTYQYWVNLDNIALKKSDAIWLISHSPGADAEVKLAKSLGKPIYYSIDEIPNRCK